jgi:hypothetical protein
VHIARYPPIGVFLGELAGVEQQVFERGKQLIVEDEYILEEIKEQILYRPVNPLKQVLPATVAVSANGLGSAIAAQGRYG